MDAKAEAHTSFQPSTPLRPDDGRDCASLPVPKSSNRSMQPIGGKIVARETVRAMRKDVTAKCCCGDAAQAQAARQAAKRAKRRCASTGI
ncbi:hypothetical protein [Devosia sp.]|uniref:hypothetical protein n=1 Tax=Devosia sp. TaxID=1871048 RepID=UPI00344EA22E